MKWLGQSKILRSRSENSIPDASMLSFLAVLIVCVTALEAQLLTWLVPIIALLVLWKALQLFTDIRSAKPWLVNSIAVIITLVIALQLQQNTILSSLLNLLLLSCCLSLLMTKRKSQAIRVAMTSYFCIASSFVFEQSLLWSILLFSAAITCTWAVFNCYREPNNAPASFIKSAFFSILWQVGAIAILCFMLMPRIPPFWKLPNLQSSKTGLSDTVDPGSIAELVRSDDLVFRASFEGQAPTTEQLYWRTIVHDIYDGQRWLQNPQQKQNAAIVPVDKNFQQVINWRKQQRDYRQITEDSKQTSSQRYPVQQLTQFNYQILAEPSDRPWLYALDAPVQHSANVNYTTDRRLQRSRQTTGSIDYRVTSISELPALLDVDRSELHHNLSLPPNSNPKTASLVQQLRGKSTSDKQFVTSVLQWFEQQQLAYTLKPPLIIGPNPIDQILFNNKQGFCAHFASSFSVMMRMAGIPARVVTGYFGGEYSSNGEFLSVYQYDAHAWSEVWLPESGWTPFDPTAFVAPQRINQGLQNSVTDPEYFLEDSAFSLNRYKDVKWINWLRMQGAYADYYWTSWIVRYNHKKQDKLLNTFTNNHTVLAVLIAGLLLVATAVIGIQWWKKRQSLNTVDMQLNRLQLQLTTLYTKIYSTNPERLPPLSLMNALLAKLPAQQQSQLKRIQQRYIQDVLQQQQPSLATLKAITNDMQKLLKQ